LGKDFYDWWLRLLYQYESSFFIQIIPFKAFLNESELYDVSHSCSPLSKFKYPNISYDDNFCLFITLKSRPFLETIVIKDYLVYSIFNGGYFFDIGNIS
jgi:hypothetical protein